MNNFPDDNDDAESVLSTLSPVALNAVLEQVRSLSETVETLTKTVQTLTARVDDYHQEAKENMIVNNNRESRMMTKLIQLERELTDKIRSIETTNAAEDRTTTLLHILALSTTPFDCALEEYEHNAQMLAESQFEHLRLCNEEDVAMKKLRDSLHSSLSSNSASSCSIQSENATKLLREATTQRSRNVARRYEVESELSRISESSKHSLICASKTVTRFAPDVLMLISRTVTDARVQKAKLAITRATDVLTTFSDDANKRRGVGRGGVDANEVANENSNRDTVTDGRNLADDNRTSTEVANEVANENSNRDTVADDDTRDDDTRDDDTRDDDTRDTVADDDTRDDDNRDDDNREDDTADVGNGRGRRNIGGVVKRATKRRRNISSDVVTIEAPSIHGPPCQNCNRRASGKPPSGKRWVLCPTDVTQKNGRYEVQSGNVP
jgi:hypothetical protein